MQNVHIFYLLPYCIHIVAQFVMLEGNSVTPKISKEQEHPACGAEAKFRLLTSCFAEVMAERLNFQLNYTDFFQLRKYIDSTLSRCCRFLSKEWAWELGFLSISMGFWTQQWPIFRLQKFIYSRMSKTLVSQSKGVTRELISIQRIDAAIGLGSDMGDVINVSITNRKSHPEKIEKSFNSLIVRNH